MGLLGYKRTAPISGDQVPDPYEPTQPFDFFKTLPGILKAISVLIGFIVLALTTVGYSQAKLFSDIENTTFCNWTFEGYGNCWKGLYHRDEICEDRNSEISSFRFDPYQNKNVSRKLCPNRWLIILPVYFIGYVWVATCIVLLVFLFLDMSAYRSFILTDYIGYIFGAILTLISALSVIAFFALVMAEDMCKSENVRREVLEKIERNFNRPRAHLVNWINYQNVTALVLEREANCSQWETYYHWIFLAVGIFAFVLGILYIVIAVVTLMRTRSEPRTLQTDPPIPMQSASVPADSRQGHDYLSPQQQQTPSMHSRNLSQVPEN